MKKTRINSGKQVKNQPTAIKKIWKKTIISVLTVIGLAGVIYALTTIIGKSDRPRFEISVTAPTPSVFSDNAAADFIGVAAIPEPNNNREIGMPGELVLLYDQVSGDYAPALRMDLTDADIESGVKIDPAIQGTWMRRGPNALVFRPKHELPADTKFTVKINPKIAINNVAILNQILPFKNCVMLFNISSILIYRVRCH